MPHEVISSAPINQWAVATVEFRVGETFGLPDGAIPLSFSAMDAKNNHYIMTFIVKVPQCGTCYDQGWIPDGYGDAEHQNDTRPCPDCELGKEST
jgi:hypothetical protein